MSDFASWLHDTLGDLKRKQEECYRRTGQEILFFVDIPEPLWIYAQEWYLGRMPEMLRPKTLRFKSFSYGDITVRKAR